MQISLIRHGKSKCIDNERMTSNEFQDWIKKYDSSGVFEETAYPSKTQSIVGSAQIIITSDLTRSIESAKLLNSNIQVHSNSLFRETELPIPNNKYWDIKLSPVIWATLLRCLWFSGYSSNCESLSSAKNRATKATQLLIKYANEHSSVVLVGHGFLNKLIAKELKKMGWQSTNRTSYKHWSCSAFSM
ncbi:histidine phosphatase family protein [Bacillus solimangrovi]|uniref:Phosphoglycerate mutase n=1 Tax=Bacillus solimangrovi TaxID=1305675 RepID=A0A1E5LF39_9BACI|nr:histidine phosphatase family protein [Bacillus solimangrovi]OEH92682.1 phosphoglycerate mutase [Bacillus solimangrovi]